MRRPRILGGIWRRLCTLAAAALTIGASSPASSASAESASPAPAPPAEEQLARIVSTLMLPAGAPDTFGGWADLDEVNEIVWAPLPPTMLDDGLPDGAYFSRKGVAALNGRRVAITATGARTMVMNVYFATEGPAIGKDAALGAMGRMGFVSRLVRAPIKSSPEAGSDWRHVDCPGKRPAWLRWDTSCDGAPCERIALMLDATLPSLKPEERRWYVDYDSGGPILPPGMPTPWDDQLASLFACLIAPHGAAAVAWSALDSAAAIRWQPLPPHELKERPARSDTTGRFRREGEIDLGGRILSVMATGTETSVLEVSLEDNRTQADRGDAMMALWRRGCAVTLARCGKSYSLSTQTWYRVAKPGSHEVVIQRTIRCDTRGCPRAQESYTISLTGKLPPLAPGEVDAVDGRCPER